MSDQKGIVMSGVMGGLLKQANCKHAALDNSTIHPSITHCTALQALVEAADVAPWYTFFVLCVMRQFKLLGRDMELLQGRILQVLLAGFIVGTLFFQVSLA